MFHNNDTNGILTNLSSEFKICSYVRPNHHDQDYLVTVPTVSILYVFLNP